MQLILPAAYPGGNVRKVVHLEKDFSPQPGWSTWRWTFSTIYGKIYMLNKCHRPTVIYVKSWWKEMQRKHELKQKWHQTNVLFRNSTVTKFLIISLGAILGANLRYWVGDWAAQRLGSSFPYGNLIINLSGSFVLGLFMTLVTDRFLVDPQLRLLVAIGFLGSYTTFSSYTLESINLILAGQLWLGLLNLFGSSLLGGLAVLLGIWLGRVI